MGNKYVNFSVHRPDQQRIADVLRQGGYQAIVTPPQNGYVVVYEKKSEFDEQQIVKVGTHLSREGDALVFAALNFDEDVFAYWLFDRGRLVDSFNSRPDYGKATSSKAESRGGDAQQLCVAFRTKASPADVQAILHGDFVFVTEQHEQLAKLTHLPSWSVGFGYEYVADGELEDELDGQPLIVL
jgi:hypothetical protein